MMVKWCYNLTLKGTWTLLLTKPGGISCVLATGKGLDTDEEDPDNVEYEL